MAKPSRSVTPSSTDPFAYVREWNRLRDLKGWWHSFELPDGTQIEGVSTLQSQKERIGAFPIPADLTGRRVLDIGTWDGWFAFEMERRGAEVMAVDCWDNPRFREMHSMLDSRVDLRLFDMYELTPERIGKFDIVIFMGVLYHLKHPLLALERVCALTTDLAVVGSYVLREQDRPGLGVSERTFMEFYETDELGGQTDNWVGPTVPCLLALCRTAGFARVELQKVLEFSACVACHRHWLPPASAAEPGPELLAAEHNMNYGINFESRFDEYVTCTFKSPLRELKREDVRPEVGGFGVRPIIVAPGDPGIWLAHFKLPLGLSAGWHGVRLSVRDSQFSNEKQIAVDLRPEVGQLVITGVADGSTWKPDELDPSIGNVVSLWIEGLPDNADISNVKVFLNAKRITTVHVGATQAKGVTQVNAQVSASSQPGPASSPANIWIEAFEVCSLPRALEIRRSFP